MKELSGAQVAFAASCGGGGYAASLDQLKTPLFFDALGSWSNDRPGLSADMRVELGPGRGAARGPDDCLGRPTTSAYYASATFRLKEWKGPSFAMATDGVIWRSETADPPREPFGAPATQVK